MRTSILLIAYIFSLNVLIAQQSDLAFLDSNIIETESFTTNIYKTDLTKTNSAYLKENETVQFSSIIKQWRDQLVNYNLKDTSVFNNSEKGIYHVVFKNKQVDITVNYNYNGEILSTKETYKNIKIPLELRIKISKVYPEYSFIKNAYHLTYSYKNGIEKQYYRIQIGNGNEKRTLKYNKNFKPI